MTVEGPSRLDRLREHYGLHRSLEPANALPYAARVLDPALPVRGEEIAVAVDRLIIDSSSWAQLRAECDDDAKRLRKRVLEIVAQAGKMQNPVLGSGGTLQGVVSALGDDRSEPAVGTRVTSLISLTCTPLALEELEIADPASQILPCRGTAVLFGSSGFAVQPPDIPDKAFLTLIDIAGTAAWAHELVESGMTVAIIGAGGRGGLLATAQCIREGADVIGLCWPSDTTEHPARLGAAAFAVDCTDPGAVLATLDRVMGERRADVVLACSNVPGCEGAAILATKDRGRIVFFSMATSFTAAALTAEALGRAPEMFVANANLPGHIDTALDLVRSTPSLLQYL